MRWACCRKKSCAWTAQPCGGLERGMAEAGIGRTLLADLHRRPYADPVPLSALLQQISETLDSSPAPTQEWRTLECLGA